MRTLKPFGKPLGLSLALLTVLTLAAAPALAVPPQRQQIPMRPPSVGGLSTPSVPPRPGMPPRPGLPAMPGAPDGEPSPQTQNVTPATMASLPPLPASLANKADKITLADLKDKLEATPDDVFRHASRTLALEMLQKMQDAESGTGTSNARR